MFEKEAEKYATQECCATCKNINHFCKEKCECWSFAKKGAEFGYNKAFVEADKNLKAIITDFNKANEWHAEMKEQLIKAKELIEELSSSLSVVGECEEEECELLNRAEEFLNESE